VIFFQDDRDYLVWISGNFFTSTERAMKDLVYIIDGDRIIVIDRFISIFYRPDQVAAKLRRQGISKEAIKIDLEWLVWGT
jgi:hypothetical protein